MAAHGMDPGAAASTPSSVDRATAKRLGIGGLAGFVVVFALVSLLCFAVGVPLGAAAGSGLFVGLFGGAGYGAMVGASS